jgi:hypothetical protein
MSRRESVASAVGHGILNQANPETFLALIKSALEGQSVKQIGPGDPRPSQNNCTNLMFRCLLYRRTGL